MTVPVGGLRARLIHDSLYHLIYDSLTALGWFAHPAGAHAPIVVLAKPVRWDEEIAPNTLALSDANVSDAPGEMGSNLTDDTIVYYVDFYAENDVIGKHVIHDVRDILRGKMPSIDRTGPVLTVYDYTGGIDSPPAAFYCELDRVVVDRAPEATNPTRAHWYACRFDVIDTYNNEDDA